MSLQVDLVDPADSRSRDAAFLQLKRFVLHERRFERRQVENVTDLLRKLVGEARRHPFVQKSDLMPYISLVRILLGPVLHAWCPVFTSRAHSDYFSVFFRPLSLGGVASPAFCFLGFGAATKILIESDPNQGANNIDKLFLANEISSLLTPFFPPRVRGCTVLQNVLEDLVPRGGIFLEQTLAQSFCIPDRLCGVLGRRCPLGLFPGAFLNRVCDACIRVCMGHLWPTLSTHNSSHTSQVERMLLEIMKKYILLGEAEMFVSYWAACIEETSISQSNEELLRVCDIVFCQEALCVQHRIITNLPTALVEKLMFSLVGHIVAEINGGISHRREVIFTAFLRPLLTFSKSILRTFQMHILMKKVPSKEVIKFCFRLLCNCQTFVASAQGITTKNTTRSTFFMPMLKQVVQTWSAPVWIEHNDFVRHLTLTKQLMYLLRWAEKDDLESDRGSLLKILLEGIQAHMESGIYNTRKLGMLVARRFSLVMDASNPLTFDSLLRPDDLDIDSDFDEKDVECPCGSKITVIEAKLDAFISERTSQVRAFEHSPCDIFNSDNENGNSDCDAVISSDSGSSDEDGLMVNHHDLAYAGERQLKTNTEGKLIRAPIYLGECLKALRNGDEFDIVFSTLSSIEQIIRRAGNPTVEMYAIELASVLIHLDNKFAIDNFSVMRNAALVALVASVPERMVPFMHRIFFGGEVSLTCRHDILSVLSKAAHKLSEKENRMNDSSMDNSMATKEAVSQKFLRTDSFGNTFTVVTKPSLAQKIGKVLKRFSQPQHFSGGEINQFNSLVGLFFFPLAAKYDFKGKWLDLISRDSSLLAVLLNTLGTYLDLAKNSTIAPQMGATILELVVSLSEHKDSKVRRAILFGLSRTLLNINKSLLWSWCAGHADDVRHWLIRVYASDVDKECRHLAKSLLDSKLLPCLR
jgi:hypothetical protein